MQVRVVADIQRAPGEVFAFFRDVDRPRRDPRSIVPVLRKTSAGETGVGTRYHEEVRALPRRHIEVESEITRFEPPLRLDYRFTWRLGRAQMDGALQYGFTPLPGGGTQVLQLHSLNPRGALRLLTPLIRPLFAVALRLRLRGIRRQLEQPAPARAA